MGRKNRIAGTAFVVLCMLAGYAQANGSYGWDVVTMNPLYLINATVNGCGGSGGGCTCTVGDTEIAWGLGGDLFGDNTFTYDAGAQRLAVNSIETTYLTNPPASTISIDTQNGQDLSISSDDDILIAAIDAINFLDNVTFNKNVKVKGNFSLNSTLPNKIAYFDNNGFLNSTATFNYTRSLNRYDILPAMTGPMSCDGSVPPATACEDYGETDCNLLAEWGMCYWDVGCWDDTGLFCTGVDEATCYLVGCDWGPGPVLGDLNASGQISAYNASFADGNAKIDSAGALTLYKGQVYIYSYFGNIFFTLNAAGGAGALLTLNGSGAGSRYYDLQSGGTLSGDKGFSIYSRTNTAFVGATIPFRISQNINTIIGNVSANVGIPDATKADTKLHVLQVRGSTGIYDGKLEVMSSNSKASFNVTPSGQVYINSTLTFNYNISTVTCNAALNRTFYVGKDNCAYYCNGTAPSTKVVC